MQTAADIAARPNVPRFSVRRFLYTVFIEGGRFWERGRLAYNGAQLLMTAVMVALRWPDAHFFADNLGSYVTFAVIANVFYSAAYLPEAILQIPQLRPLAGPVRWCVLTAGTVLACFLTIGALDTVILADPASD